MIVLDTSVLIALERKNHAVIGQLGRIAEAFPMVPCIAFPTFTEFYFGFVRKIEARREAALGFLGSFSLLNTSAEIGRRFAELKCTLEGTGVQMGDADVLIAATVLESGFVLVTGDKQFKQVPDLKVLIVDT